jgi:hypothetical protein
MFAYETPSRGGKHYKLSDGAGMYLLVTKAGARYWRFDYRFNGKRRTLALGVYPTVPLSVARERREAARRLLTEGKDPNTAKKETKPSLQVITLSRQLHGNGLISSVAAWHRGTLLCCKPARRPTFFPM